MIGWWKLQTHFMHTKLACFVLKKNLSELIFRVKLEDKSMIVPLNVRLGWRWIPVSSTLAYYVKLGLDVYPIEWTLLGSL